MRMNNSVIRHLKGNEQHGVIRHLKGNVRNQSEKAGQKGICRNQRHCGTCVKHPENDVTALGVKEVWAPTEQEQHAIKSKVL